MTEPKRKEMKPPKGPKELQTILDKWQPRVGLADWRIEIRWARPGEVSDAFGESKWFPHDQTGMIKIVQEQEALEDCDETARWSCNREAVIVHELLHCHFQVLAAAAQATFPHSLLESRIEWLTRAILEGR